MNFVWGCFFFYTNFLCAIVAAIFVIVLLHVLVLIHVCYYSLPQILNWQLWYATLDLSIKIYTVLCKCISMLLNNFQYKSHMYDRQLQVTQYTSHTFRQVTQYTITFRQSLLLLLELSSRKLLGSKFVLSSLLTFQFWLLHNHYTCFK